MTPIGRILNRFSSDLYSVDDSLPFVLNSFMAGLYGMLGTVIITCYGLPWFLVVLLPLAVLYYFLQVIIILMIMMMIIMLTITIFKIIIKIQIMIIIIIVNSYKAPASIGSMRSR